MIAYHRRGHHGRVVVFGLAAARALPRRAERNGGPCGADRTDAALLRATGRRQPCLWGWPSSSLLGPDLEPVTLSESELALLETVERQPTTCLGDMDFGTETASVARALWARRLLLLEASST